MPTSTVVPAGMLPDLPDCSFLSAQNSLYITLRCKTYLHNSRSTVRGVVKDFLDSACNLPLKSCDSCVMTGHSLVDCLDPLAVSIQSHMCWYIVKAII
jgi:hypothetical protein